jgi:ABC-type nitrate/sulfonate/bicarbonate transport system substrate-binding protein
VRISAIAIALFLFAIPPSVRSADLPAKFLFAYGGISASALPLWVGKEQGLFRKYGLDPQLVYIIAGRAAQAMVAGEVNIESNGANHVANAVASGADMTMLLSWENKLGYLFVGRPSVKRAEDLKGKKVAIGTPAGTASLATYVALDYLGLNPKRDNIALLGVGGNPDRLAALLGGGVDATSLGPEIAQMATSQGYPVLLDLAKENVPFQSSGLVTTKRFLKTNPQLMENVGKAIVEAIAFMHNPKNKQAVVGSIAKNLRIDKPDRLERAYQNVIQELPRRPCPTMQGVNSVLKIMAQYGLNPKALDLKPEDVIDLSLCKKLDDSGFMERVYQGM